MGAAEVLAELTRRGVEVEVNGDRLRFRAQGAVTPDLRAALIKHKGDLVHLLEDEEPEVRWRIEMMRQQIKPGRGFPFLVARRDFLDAPGNCLSCGDLHGPGRRFRCSLCARAAEIVVNEAWEGRHQVGTQQQGD